MTIKIIDAFLDGIFPPRCLLCDEIVEPNGFLCKECSPKLALDESKRCVMCGCRFKECECNDFIYIFDGAISPYFNAGNPQKAYYSYKFGKLRGNARFFSERMAESVNKYYQGIKFDFVTRVPSSKKGEFDHTKYLCRELADCLSLKFIDALEPTEKKRETQRKLHKEDRFRNVDCAYRAKFPCKGKMVLILDDIKTTGATLNECARRLKFAGAEKVYCISVLVGNVENSR